VKVKSELSRHSGGGGIVRRGLVKVGAVKVKKEKKCEERKEVHLREKGARKNDQGDIRLGEQGREKKNITGSDLNP